MCRKRARQPSSKPAGRVESACHGKFLQPMKQDPQKRHAQQILLLCSFKNTASVLLAELQENSFAWKHVERRSTARLCKP